MWWFTVWFVLACFCLYFSCKGWFFWGGLFVFFTSPYILIFHRGRSREGDNPAECRVLPKDPQPCQRRGQSDGEPVGKMPSSEQQLVSSKNSFWESLGPLLFFTLCPQTLKEYQRKLDTSGLKPSNDLYTEYKVRLQSRILKFWATHTLLLYAAWNRSLF